MKRILPLMALAAALALATGSTALAKRHAAQASPAATQTSATARCADPAHCPFGSCPLGSKSTESTTAAACSDPSKCTPACKPGASGSTAVAVKKQ